MTYAQLAASTLLPSGAYIFGDRDRMSQAEVMLASRLWDRLAQSAGGKVRLLNDPKKQLGRYELCRSLADAGINDFRCYRASEDLAGVRLPAFVRLERDHGGPRTEVLFDRASLAKAVGEIVMRGAPPEDVLVVEFVNVADEQGLFRKYAGTRIGDRIFAQHVMVARHWCAKRDTRIVAPEVDAESDRYTAENPHEAQLRAIFEHAHVDYGRLDYGILDRRIQVWEINDNPSFLSARPRLRPEGMPKHLDVIGALRALSEGLPDSEAIEFEFDQREMWEDLKRASRQRWATTSEATAR